MSKMDLMYPDFDGTLQEILECDLKSEMDRIVAIANGSGGDLMAELNAGPLIPEFDEYDLLDDPHGLGFGFGFTLSPHTIYSDGSYNGRGEKREFSARGELRLGKKPTKSPWKGMSHGSSIGAALSTFEEPFGGLKMVDPSSIVPVSVHSSSASGSETDENIATTDEDEDDGETLQGKVQAWIVPSGQNREDGGSWSPSPEPEFDIDESEYTLDVKGYRPISSTTVEGPPAKKRKQKHEPQPNADGKIYPKPGFSYSCLIAMSLKNSKTGSLPVSEIYKFMCDHFPYFKTAPSGWKNSVRHNLSLNKCFEKIEKPGNGARKGCLWALNPAKIHKMDEEVQKWSRKDPLSIRKAMSDPENLELIEKGELKRDYSGTGASDEDEEEEFSESNPSTPLTPAQMQARRSRASSSDSTHMETFTITSNATTTTNTTIQAASSLPAVRRIISSSRPSDQRIGASGVIDDTLEFGTITNVQGNYLCHSNGNGGYTLSFSNLGGTPTTPLIIRRTPVK